MFSHLTYNFCPLKEMRCSGIRMKCAVCSTWPNWGFIYPCLPRKIKLYSFTHIRCPSTLFYKVQPNVLITLFKICLFLNRITFFICNLIFDFPTWGQISCQLVTNIPSDKEYPGIRIPWHLIYIRSYLCRGVLKLRYKIRC